jgi:hypothetical protein
MRGAVVQTEQAVWEPLVDLVGAEVAAAFMWMYEAALEDGPDVHAYKHVATHGYLHLGVDGRAFRFREHNRYHEVPIRDALMDAFEGWEDLYPGVATDPAEVRALLARHGVAPAAEAA